jgi:hypothetical protein
MCIVGLVKGHGRRLLANRLLLVTLETVAVVEAVANQEESALVLSVLSSRIHL